MFGMAAFGATTFSDGPLSLVGSEAPGTATVSFLFGGSARVGAMRAMSATARIRFSGSAPWKTLNEIGATASFAFGGSGLLVLAGKPIIIRAVPQFYLVQAATVTFSTTAVPVDYTIRGVAH